MDEYIQELFHDNRGEKPEIVKKLNGPRIMKSEVKEAVGKMRKNEAGGPDEIVTEMITAVEEFGIEKLTEALNDVYDSGETPTDLSKSIFIAGPKKPGAIEYELHRTISLRVILARIKSRTRSEIGNEQCGFVEDAISTL